MQPTKPSAARTAPASDRVPRRIASSGGSTHTLPQPRLNPSSASRTTSGPTVRANEKPTKKNGTASRAAPPTLAANVAAAAAVAQTGTSPSAAATTSASGTALRKQQNQKRPVVDEDVFLVEPREVTFQDFEPNQTYEVSLTLTNRTPQSQFIRVARPESRFVSLTPPKGSDTTLKVAPGLSVVYTVRFTPEDADVDYHCDLQVTTDHGEFVVPVRAYSSRGQLELPKELLLDACPVKGSRSVPLFLRNVHPTTPCQWRAEVLPASSAGGGVGRNEPATASGLFALSPSFGTVAPNGGSMAVEVVFTPSVTSPPGAEVSRTVRFFLGPEGDVVQELTLRGVTTELPISLDVSEVKFQATHVTTERQAVVRVTNASDSIVKFSWKDQYADPRTLFGKTFLTNDTEVVTIGMSGRRHGESSPSAGEDTELFYDDGAGASSSFDGPFDDDVFSIEPAQGVIYGRGSKEFTVTFTPQLAMTCAATAYLEVSGRSERLPLMLTGDGVGPQCKLDFGRLNIGEVYLNAEHEYTVELTNVGVIEARYSVVSPDSEFAKKFHFSPATGALAPGASQELRITLSSDIMGVISETFHIHLHGSLTDIPLLFKGRIVGPTFVFDVEEVDYGNVSYGFWHSKTFTLTNTSHVPLHYGLRLSPACVNASHYEVVAPHGVIAAHESELIELRYLAGVLGDVQTELLVDVADVGEAVEALVVKAHCEVPTLYFSSEAIPFGHCFVGHDYTAHVEIVNDTDLSGKFAVVLTGNAEALRAQADVVIGGEEDECVTRVENLDDGEQTPAEAKDGMSDHAHLTRPSGEAEDTLIVIGPQQRVQVPIRLRAVRIGPITFTVSLRTNGVERRHHHHHGPTTEEGSDARLDEDRPGDHSASTSMFSAFLPDELDDSQDLLGLAKNQFVTALVTASACGPIVEAQPAGGVAFGSAPVLQPFNRTLSLNNTSPIPATFALRLEKNQPGLPYTVFTLEPTEGTIEPYGTVAITVHARADEAMTFLDTIVADVLHSPDSLAPIPVKATGTGFPLVTDVDLTNFDVGDVFTETLVTRSVTVTNHGRKDQEVQWHNVRGSKVKEGAAPITFHIKPERAYIAPRESVTFTVEGFAESAGTFSDEFFLKQTNTFKEILRGKVTGTFVPPLLTYSTRALAFEFVNTADMDTLEMSFPSERKSFTVRNVTTKSLQVLMKLTEPASKTPFTLDVEPTLTLAAGETRVVGVVFNPSYRADRVTHDVKTKIRVTFVNHPRQETINLSARLVFPGLVLDPLPDSTLDFGVVLTNTEGRRSVTLTNPSTEIPATFEWNVLHDKDDTAVIPKESTNAGVAAAIHESGPLVDPSRCFDLIPFKGTLAPGASQVVDVAFYGTTGTHRATALCHITGGPTHRLTLLGSAGEVRLQYDRQSLDFGVMPYYSEATKSITISNPSRVAVSFQVTLPTTMKHAKSIRVSPMSGVIHDKVKLTVTFCPVVPDGTLETFTVQIAHFDPQPITVMGRGVVHTVALAGTDDKAKVTRSMGFNPAFETALQELRGDAYGESDTTTTHDKKNKPSARTALSPSPQSHHQDPFVPYAIRTANSEDVLELYRRQPHPNAREVEAERLALCAALTTTPPALTLLPPVPTSSSRSSPPIPAGERSPHGGATGTEQHAARPVSSPHASSFNAKAQMKKHYQTNRNDDPLRRFNRRNSNTAMFDGSVKYVLARYTIDFGHMTRNETRTTKVSLVNTCSERVFLLMDQKELVSTPVSVNPSKMPQLDPLESTTLEVTFNAAGAVMVPLGSGGGASVTSTGGVGMKAAGRSSIASAYSTTEGPNGAMVATATTNGVQHSVPTIHPGENLIEFALDIKGGPVIVIQCRCYVATPMLRVSETALDFGKVLLGQAKMKSLTLRNDQAIPCEWRLVCKEPTGKAPPKRVGYLAGVGLEDKAPLAVTENAHHEGGERLKNGNHATTVVGAPLQQFWTSKDSGVLEANESTTVDVFFAPFYNKRSHATLTFRFVNNAKVQEVRCEGEASALDVSLAPSPLVMPVVRPQQVATSTVTLTNNEDKPVEVFTHHGDATYQEEKDILKHALRVLGTGSEQRLLMPSRGAAERIPEEMVRAVYDALGAEAATLVAGVGDAELDATLRGEVEGQGGPGSLPAGAGTAGAKGGRGGKAGGRAGGARAGHGRGANQGRDTTPEGRAPAAARDNADGEAAHLQGALPPGSLSGAAEVDGELSGRSLSQRMAASAPPVTVLLVGPPEAGKSTQAARLEQRLGLAPIDLNTLVLAEAERDTANGEVIRNILTILVRQVRPVERKGPQPPQLPSSSSPRRDAFGDLESVADDDLDELGRCPLTFQDERTLTATWLQNTVESNDHLRTMLSRPIDESTGTLTPRTVKAAATTVAGEAAADKHKASPGKQSAKTSPSRAASRAGSQDDVNEEDSLANYERFIPGIVRSLLRAEMEAALKEQQNQLRHVDLAEGGALRLPGFVLDDVRCCLTANKRLLFDAVKEVSALLGSRLLVYSLDISEAGVGLRSAISEEALCRERAEEAFVSPLSEADYEQLQPVEREGYNLQLRYYNECRRELQRATRRRTHFEAILKDGPQPSVQETVEEEAALAQTARLEATLGTKNGAPRKATSAKKTEAPDYVEPAWNTLDEMQAFKELWGYLLHEARAAEMAPPVKPAQAAKSASAATSARSAASGKKGASPSISTVAKDASTTSAMSESLPIHMSGEQERDALAEQLLTSLEALTVQPTASMAASSSAHHGGAGERTASGETLPDAVGGESAQPTSLPPFSKNADGGAGRRERGVKWPEFLSQTMGGDVCWDYLDAARFAAAWSNPAGATDSASSATSSLTQYVRFLALVEREIPVQVNMTPAQLKKNANKPKPPPSVVRNMEPMTRWVIPAKSSLELTVEFCCGHAGTYTIPCEFGVVGSQQKLSLTVQGHAALPDMARDEKLIFPVCRAKVPVTGRCPAKVFWTAKRTFDFGPLLVPAQAPKRRRSERGAALVPPQSNQALQPKDQADGGSGAAGGVDSLPPATSEEMLTFTNKGVSTAEVTLAFETEKDRCFSVYPTSFSLPVGGSEQVRLRATPEAVGEVVNRLVATVKDNPSPWSVTVTCTGSRPSLTVDGKKDAELDFGRSSLNRATALAVTLENTSRMPVRWTLAGLEKLPPELSVSEASGILDENATEEITFTFHPTSTCLHNIPLVIQVSDAGSASGVPPGQSQANASAATASVQPLVIYETLPLTVKAEGHDVILEWTKEIDFQLMHVGETRREVFRILNKSPYDVGYMIRLPKRLQNTITLSPQTGTIRGMLGHKDAAMANVEVTARFEKEGEINKKLGQLEVAFFDPTEEELVYPLQTVPIRGEAWFTRYTVKPSIIDFGSCFFDQRKQASFEIKNVGRFPVSYALFDHKEGCDALRKEASAAFAAAMGVVDSSAPGQGNTGTGGGSGSHGGSVTASTGAGRSGSTGGAAGATAKKQTAGKSGKGSDNTEIALGCFTVTPARGVVPVGESVTIEVVTIPDATSRTRETLGVFVGQSHPELEAKGTPVELMAQPATPGIAADLSSPADVETVFEEQQVVFRLSQFDYKAKAFGKEDRAFSFGTALVGHRTEERFRIANTSPLPCTVVAQLITATGALPIPGTTAGATSSSGKGSQSITRPEGFDIRYDGSTSRDAVYAGLIEEAAAASGGENRAQSLSHSRRGRGTTRNSPPLSAEGANEDSGLGTLTPSPTGTVRLILPPFESRFVTVGFTPTSLQRFEARFLATVDNGNDPRTNCLSFHLLGSGTLPNVAYLLPPPLVSRQPSSGSGAAPSVSAAVASGGDVAQQRAPGKGSGSGSIPGASKSAVSVSSGPSVTTGKKASSSGAAGHRDGNGGMDGMGSTLPDMIQLPITRVGAHSSRYFTIRNVGDVTADLRVTLASDDGLAAGLSVTKRNQDISIPVGSEEVFEISYAPTAVGKSSMKLNVSLLDNPFEDKELVVEAQSFSQPVSFEHIDPATTDFLDLGDCYAGQPREHTFVMRNSTNSRLRFLWRSPSTTAEAEAGASASPAARPAAPAVVVDMVPNVGHIAPGASKTITARVLCKETPAQANESNAPSPATRASTGATGQGSPLRVLACELEAHSIELYADDVDALGAEIPEWDSSLMNQKWAVATNQNGMEASGTMRSNGAGERPHSGLAGDAGRRNLRKVLEPVPEPDYRLTDSVACVQPLNIGYVCERPRFELALVNKEGTCNGAPTTQPLEAIAFETTKMFQRRIVTVRVTNTSGIALPFSFRTTQHARGTAAAGAPGNARRASGGKNLVSSDASVAAFADARSEANQGTALNEFYVEPAEGSVPVGGFVDVSVVYAPRVAALATGLLSMEFPFSERPLVEAAMSGSGECPLVHFYIPQSTYLENRVDGEAGPITDPETLLLEFMTRGLHSRTTVKFKVINPTALSYPFEWVDRSATGSLSPFRCLTRAGTIAAGKQLEMAFEFSADTLGTREALWSFDIQGKASVPFLLVGKAVEPDVFFTTSKLSFGCVNVRNRVEKTIMIENRDDIPFGFAFDKLEGQASTTVTASAGIPTTAHGGLSALSGKKAKNNMSNAYLTVKPVSGVVGPKEKLPITISFAPTEEMEYNVPLICRVKKASTPLTVNVKGEGISTHDSLYIEAPETSGSSRDNGATTQPLIASKGQLLSLNLGRVQVDERVTRRFVLTNTGQYPFDFAVSAPERRFITLENTQGTVAPKQRVIVTFVYHPTAEETLRQYRITFKTGTNKSSYTIGVQAVTYIPKLNLGFERYDFGPRFITQYNPDHVPSTVLTLTNNDKDVITVDCGMTEGNEWCHLDNSSFVVKPNETSEVRLSFSPEEVRMYDDKLKLLLNGVYPVYIPISGEGVVPRVEVLNHIAKLGVARVGEKREVELKIACRSRIPTLVSFSGCLDDDLLQKGISISSGQSLLLKPREVRVVTVTFKPTRRMGEFQREMKMLVCGRECPFALITGACEDSEIHLDTTQLHFDDVVVGSSATRRLVIMNSGDISQKFAWNLRHGGELTVNAPSAFIRAHTEFVCEFTYTPARADSYLRKAIDVTFDNAPPMAVSVEANAMPRPAAKTCVQFQCRARETDTQYIPIENTFSQPWSFTPVFDKELWSMPKGSESALTMKPKGKASVAVQYRPVKETPDGSADFGTMFIPQPDGTGLTFTLEGHAEAPGPAAPLTEVDLEAKSEHTLSFSIRNWASVPLRFTREVVWNPEPEDGLIAVRGASGLEVLPNNSKEYSMELSCMREGTYRGTVYFRCVERPEMIQYFEVALRVSGQPNAAVHDLRAMVRSGTSHNIPVSNPLAKPVAILAKVELAHAGSSHGTPASPLTVPAGGASATPTAGATSAAAGASAVSDYFIVPTSITVPGKSAVNLPVQFFPLVHRDYAPVRVVLSSPELGMSRYVFRLFSSAPPQEKTTQLLCPLGQNQLFTLRFVHYCRSNTEFVVHLNSGASAATGGRGAGGSARSRGLNTTMSSTGNESAGAPSGGGAAAAGVITIARAGGGASPGGAGGVSGGAASSTLKVSGGSGWPKGQEVGLEFLYEPQAVGTVKEVVEFSSAQGGTYVFPIIATCTEPERQGPVAIKAGSQNTQIPFKNVFSEPITVSIATDNPTSFIVPKKTETIPPKKTVNLAVQFKPSPGPSTGTSASSTARSGGATTSHATSAREDVDSHVGNSDVTRGKLLVSCVPPGHASPVEWVYYLEAGRSEKEATSGRRGTVRRK